MTFFRVRIDRSGELLASHVGTASSLWARFLGLMGRAALEPGEGLWFPGDTSIHMLFMRVPIDAVFLAPARHASRRAAGQTGAVATDRWIVVSIRADLRPWTGIVWYVRGARGCLELESGAASRAGLQTGDTVRFEV